MDRKKENKFNFSEPVEKTNKDRVVEESKEAIKRDARGLFNDLRKFLSNLLDFRDDTDRETTINAIKGDIPFKGATAWILIFAIFTASIGLNVSSTAVVIGAMLISPLMGPILGVGMSLALNDIDTLKRSVINLMVMILLSLITAFLYFKLSPLTELTPELEARVKPTILDVLVAIFGGLALIVARTKKGTIASVIFGVAIATALMPPLCTAGYGLAVGDLRFFFGAMYLFTINTIFIALSTFVVLKILRFPMLKYANSKRRRFIARLTTVLAVIVVIPAIWTFVLVLNESNFNRDAKAFINNELTSLPHSDYIKKNAIYKFSRENKTSSIELNTFGLDIIPESTISVLKSRMQEYSALSETQLIFNQDSHKGVDSFKYMAELRSRDSLDLLSQSQKINILEDKVKSLSVLERNQIPFEDISKEVKINYDHLEALSYAVELTTNFSKIDTIPVFTVKWRQEAANQIDIVKEQEKLEAWLKIRLNKNTLVVKQGS